MCKEGLELYAGPTFGDHAAHTVLWTQKTFEGPIQIDYEYTRLDTTTKCVNIIYIHAQGTGENGFEKDIKKWKETRKEPFMHWYFNHMNAYHISYAAFGMKNESPKKDYIRMRRYNPTKIPFKASAVKGEYFETNLFKPSTPYHIQIKVNAKKIKMNISNLNTDYKCEWNIESYAPLTKGRIGLRQMFTRNARYQNFKITSWCRKQ